MSDKSNKFAFDEIVNTEKKDTIVKLKDKEIILVGKLFLPTKRNWFDGNNFFTLSNKNNVSLWSNSYAYCHPCDIDEFYGIEIGTEITVVGTLTGAGDTYSEGVFIRLDNCRLEKANG